MKPLLCGFFVIHEPRYMPKGRCQRRICPVRPALGKKII